MVPLFSPGISARIPLDSAISTGNSAIVFSHFFHKKLIMAHVTLNVAEPSLFSKARAVLSRICDIRVPILNSRDLCLQDPSG